MHTVDLKIPTGEKRLTYINLSLSLETTIGQPHKDGWTPSLSKAFKVHLLQQELKPTSINRTLATLRHFARFIHEHDAFLAGDPFHHVKDIRTDEVAWNGLNSRQISLCKSAIDIRVATCKRKNQNPLLEAAIFYTLLHTGMRSFELTSIQFKQYYNGGFHFVKRKGELITKKITVPSEARYWLDRFIHEVRLTQFQIATAASNNLPTLIQPHDELYIFVPRNPPNDNKPINERSIREMMERISNQASTHLAPKEKFRLAPHMLRHTFGKHVADKHGVHAAQKLLGNVSMKEVWNYTKPSPEEIADISEKLYD